jgi:UDP-N-acetylmuramate: L-alanyl-gamma-D-glutamyl-meso-diaminopimelate ligase
MHNLAIELHLKGYQISGSDDEIYNPAKSNLKLYGLLPDQMGWNPNNIHDQLDMIVLGMHAKTDNPELAKAQDLGLKIVSYPEFIAFESKNKKRVVVAGSHGKTTTTSMILHALQTVKIDFDYLVGARIKGFDRMVKITDSDLIVIEGDEYLSSPLDRKPKILHYQPHIAIITGIAWDHINVFPTFQQYVYQFELFISSMAENAIIVYNQNDEEVVRLARASKREDLSFRPYSEVVLNDDRKIVSFDGKEYTCGLIGRHNYQNLAAALMVCEELGLSQNVFFESMADFSGPHKRLQLVKNYADQNTLVYLDFAHAPSKVETTVRAVKDWYPEHTLHAFFELHTYSSLNPEFLMEYNGALAHADNKIVFYDRHTLEMKNMADLERGTIKEAFNDETIIVYNNRKDLEKYVQNLEIKKAVFLFMTSGNFMNLDIEHILDKN